MRLACVIPTYNGKSDVIRLLKSLKSQTVTFDIFIVDSSSVDGTRELVEAEFNNALIIPSTEFNHGGTRQRMVDENPEFDFYVFLTQDVCLIDERAIEHLVEPFSDPKVGAVCGRQLPHLDAAPLAAHARFFNYPSLKLVKTKGDISRLGINAAFMSNSFAAYRRTALQAVGGFPKHVVFAEDMYVAARMLLTGWSIVYAGDAQCLHSHNYSIREEFSRYFDMGVFHARESWIQKNFGGIGGEGLRYVRSELSFLGLRRFYLWPDAILRNAAKLLGYRLGQRETKLPIRLKRAFGMHKRYWDGPFSIRQGND